MKFMPKKNLAIVPFALVLSLIVTACDARQAEDSPSSTGGEVNVTVSSAPASPTSVASKDSFVDRVLTTPEVEIKITDSRVIPVGEVGNERGNNPVIAIWYETTNLGTSQRDITPMEFIYKFEAIQDNNPDVENSLRVASLPDDAFLQTQTQKIKPNGTSLNAIAYELSDTTTPVELVAEDSAGVESGRMTFNLVK